MDKTKNIYIVALADSGAMLHDLGRSYWFFDGEEAEVIAEDLNRRNGLDPDDPDCESFWEVLTLEHGSEMQDKLSRKKSEEEGDEDESE